MLTFYGTRLSDNMAETPEGYLICYDVNIARIGTQDYLGSELGISDEVVKVNRPAEEVFKPATVASFEGKPFTNDHPYELLDANNTSIYSKGHLQNVRVSDDKTYLVGDIIVTDSQAVQDIKNGKREISAGYNCDCLQDDNGNWYQANIIGNHVALVDKGRAGEKVRINDAEWNEADHPRAENGQFGKGSGGSAPKQEKSGDKNMKSYEEAKSEAEKQLKLAYEKSGGKENTRTNYLQGQIKYYESQIKEKPESGESSKENTQKSNTKNTYSDIPDRNNVNWKEVSENARKSYDSLALELFSKRKTHPVLIHSWTEKTIDNGLDGAFISWVKEHSQENPERAKALSELDNAFKSKDPDKASECWYKLWETMKKKYATNNKEKSMKDSKTLLGRMFKAFAQDAEPEEIVEALNEVKGEDEEPDRIGKLEAMVQDLCSRMDAYDEAHKPAEEPETTALDEAEKELLDAEPEEEKKEVEDEDANNDPKLIEAVAEKAQNDEDTTEEIKKEIADAKKVIAKIEDKETRLAVADSFAKIIRGKMKSSENYKKLMDASNKKPEVKDSKAIDYNEVFKKIKEEKFRK